MVLPIYKEITFLSDSPKASKALMPTPAKNMTSEMFFKNAPLDKANSNTPTNEIVATIESNQDEKAMTVAGFLSLMYLRMNRTAVTMMAIKPK